jgi:hypothetical protein
MTGDVGETFNALRADRKLLRAKYGVNCPKCRTERPKAEASLLLPAQRCKVDGYRDPRPRLTPVEQAAAGCTFIEQEHHP